MKSRITGIMSVIFIQLVLTLPFYTTSAYALTISNVNVTQVTSNSARIEWDTDIASNGRLKYGKTISLGFTQRHDNLAGHHELIASNGVDSDTAYFFSLESTDLNGTTAIDNNSGNFYTFKTIDVTPPPQVAGLRLLSSSPDSIVLSWNEINVSDLSHYAVYRNKILIANSTVNSFTDTNIAGSESAELKYKISAVDTSGNEGPQSDTLIISALLFQNQSTAAKNDVVGVFINLTIHRFVNRRVIDIVGSTKPFANVMLFVNDMTTAKRALDSSEVGSSGKFVFTQVQLRSEQDNVIKVITFDKFGNKNERTFEVAVDTQAPTVQLDEIPSLTSKKNLSISGTVSEPVLIKVFVDANTNESLIPSKVIGLNVTKAGQNSVELRWDESKDKDFSHYIVYREGSGAIALTKPANFNLFIDALVDSGKSYTYQVSAMNVFGNEGEKSEPITVATLTGGQILNLKPPQVDIFEDFRKPAIITNASDKLNFGIKLSKGDATYKIKLVFEDRAGNIVILEKIVVLDTKKPTVKITSPPSGALIFENVANEVNVIGKTEANARVHLFVDRTPFSLYDKSFEIETGLPSDILPSEGSITPQARLDIDIKNTYQARLENDIRNLPVRLENVSLPEDRLDAKCRSGVSTAICPTGADFSTTADSQGNFKFENVDLTVLFGGAARLREVSPTDFRDTLLNLNKETKGVNIIVIATDKTGQRGTDTRRVNIGTCWSGNQSWDIIPLTEHQSPALLSTERLAEGTEEPNFYFNYSYIGRGARATIVGVNIAKACGTRELLDPRFNISCQLMPSGVTTKMLNQRVSTAYPQDNRFDNRLYSPQDIAPYYNPSDAFSYGSSYYATSENMLSYSVMKLSRFPGMDTFLEDDWKGFIKAINKELTFPLKVRITYRHDADGDGNFETETQTTCEQVSYVVDSSLIDPRKVLPDFLLYDFVDFLQASIKTLTDIQEQLDKVIDYVAIGCLGSFGLNFVLQIHRRWVTFWDEKKYAFNSKNIELLAGMIGAGKTSFTQGNEEHCKNVIETIVNKRGSFKLKYVNDIDLKKCFPSSASAWDAEAKVYSGLRWSCDRIFGHAAPSKWTESKDDTKLSKKIEDSEGCEGDESRQGQPLTAENCREFARKNPNFRAAETFGPDAKCTLLRSKEGAEVYTVGELVQGSERLYELNHISAVGGLSGKTKYAVQSRRSESKFITAQPKTCAELCNEKYGGKKQGSGDTIEIQEHGKKAEGVRYKAGDGIYGECTTTEKCRKLNSKGESERVLYTTKNARGDELQGKIEFARTWGYTSNCFYQGKESDVRVVSDSHSEGEECCCIRTEGKPEKMKTRYYQPNDYDPLYEPERRAVHQPKKDSAGSAAEDAVGIAGLASSLGEKDYAKMKWSYRYWKEKFQTKGTDGAAHNEYHPKRYIEGRDLPACFGQDNLFYKAFGDEEKVLTVDPFKDHFAALQCVHLSGVSNRLQFLKNLMASLSTCLIQVRTSGRGDAGACKELFTQYVCDALWQFVRYFADKGCATTEHGTAVDLDSTSVADYVKGGFKSVYESINDVQSEITHEYGNAKLNDLLGTGEESVARKVCLAAFGYDWELNVKNLVDAAYTTPYATLVQPITRKREFLAIEPTALKPKYEYRASWIINPGCDFERYDVFLTCVGRKQLDTYPNQIKCSEVGAPSIGYVASAGTSSGVASCDCIGLPDEKGAQLIFSGRLKQNVVEDKRFHKVISDSPFRYDHLKFVLRTDRRIPANVKSNCFQQGYDNGEFYFPLFEKNPRDIADCRADPLSGSFTCAEGEVFTGRKGVAEFVDIFVNDNNINTARPNDLIFDAGDSLKVDATIRSVGQNKCLKVEFEGQSQVLEVFEGIQQYSITTGQLSLGARQQTSQPQEISVRLINSQTSTVSVNVAFFDKNGNSLIELGRTQDSGDEVVIDSQPSININELANEGRRTLSNGVEVSVENQYIRIKKQDAEIEIQGVSLGSRDRLKRNSDGVAFIDGVIRIFPQSEAITTGQLQQQSQPKRLTVGLYHIRDEPQLSGIPACNLNDAVIGPNQRQQEKTINIRVGQRPTDAGLQSPSFSNIIIMRQRIERQTVPQIRLEAGQPIDVSATIRQQSGIESAELTCTKPDRSQVNVQRNTKFFGDDYEFIIPSQEVRYAGAYDCRITAKGKNAQAREGSASVRFEVLCGDKDNYGKCKKDGRCCKDTACTEEIIEGLKCGVPPSVQTNPTPANSPKKAEFVPDTDKVPLPTQST